MWRRYVRSPLSAEAARLKLAAIDFAPRSFILEDRYASWPPLLPRRRLSADDVLGPAAQALADCDIAKALATPVRMCRVTRQRLPAAFLQAYTVHPGELKPAVDGAGGRKLYLLDAPLVLRQAKRTLVPKRAIGHKDRSNKVITARPDPELWAQCRQVDMHERW